MTLSRWRWLLLIVASQLSGCAFLYTFDSDLEQRVDGWIAEHHYAMALDTLDQVRPSHPQYAALQKKKLHIMTLIQQYEEETVQKSRNLVKQHQWLEADEVFTAALLNIPQSKLLNDSYAQFRIKRERQLKSLACRIHINKAEWTLKNAPLAEELARIQPSEREGLRLQQLRTDESRAMFEDLVMCGKESLKSAELDLAEQSYAVAEQLNPGGRLFHSDINVQQQLAAIEKQRVTILSPKTGELLESSQQALKKDDVKQAYKLYRQIPAHDRQHAEVRQFHKILEQRVTTNINQGLEMGRKLYSQGDVERALAIWTDIRDLAPDNEQLLNHIERAQRVLNKLKRLQKTEPVIAPPTMKKDKS